VRDLEHGADDTFTVVRWLRQLYEADAEVPRPPLEAGDAVSLMTIHSAKGLEWPVVIVPDLVLCYS
jgi:ATP-dependent helicase/nuclease subunit A